MTRYHDYAYLEMVRDILTNGVRKENRTGVDTLAVFSRQMRFDLSEGSIPLLTTKKMHTRSVIYEILWYLKGGDNVKYLNDNGVTIWDEWKNANGNLGPVYGNRWRKWGKPKTIFQPTPNLRKGIAPTYLGIANGNGSTNHPLGKVWEGMIARCYDTKSISYKYYGAKGVHVVDRWLEFEAFAEDAKTLPSIPNHEGKLVLDKDGIGNGFVYGPNHCQWITPTENSYLKWDKIVVLEHVSTGNYVKITNPYSFCKEAGLPKGADKNLSDLWTSRKNAKERYGYRLISCEPKNKHIDQVADVIHKLRTNPNDRRLLINAWDPAWIEYMALPPCHYAFQFYVAEGKLSCMLNQRSCDVGLGVPFNIVQYSILTHMFAQVTNLEPGEFIWNGGDVHIYVNHIEQLMEQITREPYPSPTLKLNPEVKEIDDFTFEDFEIVDYKHHPLIRMEVAK